MQIPLSTQDFLERAALVYGPTTAVVDEPDPPGGGLGELTYSSLADRVAALQAGLDEIGTEVGARVAVVSQNSARLLELLYAVPASGRVLVPVNFRLSAAEVGYIMAHSGAEVLLVDPEVDRQLSAVRAQHRLVLGASSDEVLLRPGVAPRSWLAEENATATINYTSGTTARPKGVQLTHRNLWTNAVTFGWHTGVRDTDVYLHTLPMFHANGWGMPFALAGMGVPQVVLRKVDGTEILRRVQAHGVTLLCAAPAVLAAALEAASQWDGPVPGSGTTRVVCAGAPPPTRTIERVEAELGWEFIQIYGLTETSPLLTINRAGPAERSLTLQERAVRLGRAGSPAVGARICVAADGEVLARSNVVMAGYWEQPVESGAALAEGWFHTGDGGSLDASGYLTIRDRKKDVIITGGENVSSIEVEDRLFRHPAVAEAAVIGIPSEKWGETVLGLVVLDAGSTATEAELIAFCREGLAHYKCPTRVEVLAEIPRTATGKIQKFKLREPYWAGRDRHVN